ncbi:MAG: haloacid dehalogenase [Verrucomicrobiales bacterium VVV1]|nr:MAG: haloacid dehalogenase [Verrucomicrobiales bacterium VVV1]
MSNGLIFDLDGTLVDSLRGIAVSLNLALSDHLKPTHSEQAVRHFIGNGARELVTKALGPGASETEVDALEESFKVHYAANWASGTDVFPGVVEMLKRQAAAGHRLGVLSNKPHDFTVEIVSRLFPEIAFDAVLGQRPDVPRKPDPAGALEIAAAFGLPPAACVMVGDSTMDVETGVRAGMYTVAVTWGYHDAGALLGARPDVVADSLDDLERMLP